MSEESYMMRDDAEDKSTAIGEEEKKRESGVQVYATLVLKSKRSGVFFYTHRVVHT